MYSLLPVPSCTTPQAESCPGLRCRLKQPFGSEQSVPARSRVAVGEPESELHFRAGEEEQ